MSSASTPLLSIIIVNFNEEQFIVPLLESFQKFEPTLLREIIILDNHSITDIPSLLGNRFPEVFFLPQKTNEGFGRTNNLGIKMAKGKYILVLNPDMLLQDSSISACIDYMEMHAAEKTGAVACKLKNTDGTYQKSFFRLSASVNKTVQSNPVYIKLFGQKIKLHAERIDNAAHEKISKAPWLCGAFLLMNRETLLKEQFFFDEDIFLYSEDCELGHRIRRKGYRLIYLPDQSIIHFGGGSQPYQRRLEQLTISEWLCMMKVHGKLYFFLNQLLLTCNFLMDEFFFRKAAISGVTTFKMRREKIIRHRLWQLWRRYTFRILLLYGRSPSSSKEMLKFF